MSGGVSLMAKRWDGNHVEKVISRLLSGSIFPIYSNRVIVSLYHG